MYLSFQPLLFQLRSYTPKHPPSKLQDDLQVLSKITEPERRKAYWSQVTQELANFDSYCMLLCRVQLKLLGSTSYTWCKTTLYSFIADLGKPDPDLDELEQQGRNLKPYYSCSHRLTECQDLSWTSTSGWERVLDSSMISTKNSRGMSKKVRTDFLSDNKRKLLDPGKNYKKRYCLNASSVKSVGVI